MNLSSLHGGTSFVIFRSHMPLDMLNIIRLKCTANMSKADNLSSVNSLSIQISVAKVSRIPWSDCNKKHAYVTELFAYIMYISLFVYICWLFENVWTNRTPHERLVTAATSSHCSPLILNVNADNASAISWQ